MPSCTMLLPGLSGIRPCTSDKWLGTHLSYKKATSWPSWIWSRKKKITCICKPSFIIRVPSLNNIGKCMSEKWLRMCSSLGFLQLKWQPVGHLWSDRKIKWGACVWHCVLYFYQRWTKSDMHVWEMVGETRLSNEMAASRPSWIWCRRQMTCISAFEYHHVLSLC